jgi:hypothetical protein
MSLKNKLTNNGSNLTAFNGSTPSTMSGASNQSKLHDEYSLNGNPNILSKPSPSQLDLNGLTPPKYTDNLPG